MDSDRIEGKAKEVEGTVTGDEDRKEEGEAQGAWGKAKDSVREAADDVEEAIDRRT